MKILHVSTTDTGGGAARAAKRLHKALLAHGAESLMLVQNKRSDDHTVKGPSGLLETWSSEIRHLIDHIPVVFYKKRSRLLFSPSWVPLSTVPERIRSLSPDIVHLHWICGGMLRIEDLARIPVPVVWSLHDMWPFTGGCHYNLQECSSYTANCGRCPVLGSSRERDLSRRIFLRKKKTYTKKDLTIVGVSRWMSETARSSVLLKDKKHVVLPNPLNTEIFKPMNKKTARELWGLSKDKKLILFGAPFALSDAGKGFHELTEALKLLKREDTELIVFGASRPLNPPDFGFRAHYLGYLHDDVSLVTLYNAADVMVVPSLFESFGQTATESMACGTPVVAFNTSGLRDIVDHLTNGYLAKSFEPADLAAGIDFILSADTVTYKKLSKEARIKVLRNFDSRVVAEKYLKLYREILNSAAE